MELNFKNPNPVSSFLVRDSYKDGDLDVGKGSFHAIMTCHNEFWELQFQTFQSFWDYSFKDCQSLYMVILENAFKSHDTNDRMPRRKQRNISPHFIEVFILAKFMV